MVISFFCAARIAYYLLLYINLTCHRHQFFCRFTKYKRWNRRCNRKKGGSAQHEQSDERRWICNQLINSTIDIAHDLFLQTRLKSSYCSYQFRYFYCRNSQIKKKNVLFENSYRKTVKQKQAEKLKLSKQGLDHLGIDRGQASYFSTGTNK